MVNNKTPEKSGTCEQPACGQRKNGKNRFTQYMKSAQVTRWRSLGSAHWSNAKKHGKIPNFTSCF